MQLIVEKNTSLLSKLAKVYTSIELELNIKPKYCNMFRGAIVGFTQMAVYICRSFAIYSDSYSTLSEAGYILTVGIYLHTVTPVVWWGIVL